MTGGDNYEYVLGRSFSDSARLHTVDPQIPAVPDTRIADIGAGTGPNLPSNVSPQIMSVFPEVPNEFIGKYDAVHTRLWCYIVRGGNTASLNNHATQLLNVLKFRTKPHSQSCIPIVTKTFLKLHSELIDSAYKAGLPSLPPRNEDNALLTTPIGAMKRETMYGRTLVTLLTQKPASL
ncbi:hypothetical protein V8C37DRAFT_407457 [Trichoderma ceciliae]